MIYTIIEEVTIAKQPFNIPDIVESVTYRTDTGDFIVVLEIVPNNKIAPYGDEQLSLVTKKTYIFYDSNEANNFYLNMLLCDKKRGYMMIVQDGEVIPTLTFGQEYDGVVRIVDESQYKYDARINCNTELLKE